MSKGPGVQKMFDDISGRYDLMNRVMTFGQDQKWRKFVVTKSGTSGKCWSLDLASGTGDIAALMTTQFPDTSVIAADFSINMLREAQKRFSNETIYWLGCDANELPYKDNFFQSCTFGYLLRNVDNVLQVLCEVHRVLAPGGKVACLDTTPPRKNLLYPFIQLYLRFGIPILGKMIARDEAAYSYLTGSTLEFYGAEELAQLFSQAGFKKVSFKKFMSGTIAVHWGEK